MTRTKSTYLALLATAAFAVAGAGSAQASVITVMVSGNDGPFSADAVFTFNDNGATTTLGIQLTNTGGTDDPGNAWLTGLFFGLAGSPTMTYTGLGGDGSDSFNDLVNNDLSTYTALAGEDADHFWGLNQEAQTNLDSTGGQEYALFAAGFFSLPSGNTDVLDFTAGGPSPQPDGSDGGIINTATGTGGPEPKILDGIWFTFDLGDYQFSLASVDNVWFQYGTSSDQPGFCAGDCVSLPEPGTLSLLLIGFAGVAWMRRRKIV
jgi:hypothetical protein